MTHDEIIKRRHDIYEMREKGMKFKDIADIYGVTLERVRQIYHKEVRIKEYESLGCPLNHKNKQWGYYK